MKKVLGLIIVVVAALTLVACKKDNNPPNGGSGDSDIDLRGQDFVIVVDNVASIDPRLDTYQGLFKEEKAANIAATEKKYNVKIKYVTYPSNASWGGARERWIVSQAESGVDVPHVFQVFSASTATLATQEAILPLNDLIEKYGVEGYWEEKIEFNQLLGHSYLYDDTYPLADDGIYYNSDLLAEKLGEEYRNLPTELWLEDKWTWAEFEKIVNQLYDVMDRDNPNAMEYVMGGRPYNWLYPMLGSNGAQLVDSNFEVHVASEPVLETIDFLHKIYRNENANVWIGDAPLSNASQPEFTAGRVVFHNGETWHISASNKWGNANFPIDFVPYPKGPNVTERNADYFVNHVIGKSSYAISSSYSIDRIPAGYEDKMIHSETIFRIWADIQYFPAIDSKTGQVGKQTVFSDFEINRLMANYGSDKSIDAHMSVLDLAKVDLFYSFIESNTQDFTSGDPFMTIIQSAIESGESRSKMESIKSQLENIIEERIFSKLTAR